MPNGNQRKSIYIFPKNLARTDAMCIYENTRTNARVFLYSQEMFYCKVPLFAASIISALAYM